MNPLNLVNETLTLLSSAAVSAGMTDVDGGIIDMQQAGGFDAIMHTMLLGDVADTSVITLSVRESDNSDGSSSSEISGATVSFTAGASTADSKIMIVDVAKRTKRYVRCKVTRATANAPIAAIIATLYKAHAKPVTQTSVVIAQKLVTG